MSVDCGVYVRSFYTHISGLEWLDFKSTKGMQTTHEGMQLFAYKNKNQRLKTTKYALYLSKICVFMHGKP